MSPFFSLSLPLFSSSYSSRCAVEDRDRGALILEAFSGDRREEQQRKKQTAGLAASIKRNTPEKYLL